MRSSVDVERTISNEVNQCRCIKCFKTEKGETMLRRIRKDEFKDIYNIMKNNFSKDEHRLYEEQRTLLDNPKYQICVLPDDLYDTVKGFIAFWEFDKMAYIEHFAVDEKHRNEGLGSRILNHLTGSLDKRVCLEVSLPKDEVSIRRIEFYKKNNFFLNRYDYMQPPISKGRNPIPFMLMTSESLVTKHEFEGIKNTLYKEVYKQENFNGEMV